MPGPARGGRRTGAPPAPYPARDADIRAGTAATGRMSGDDKWVGRRRRGEAAGGRRVHARTSIVSVALSILPAAALPLVVVVGWMARPSGGSASAAADVD